MTRLPKRLARALALLGTLLAPVLLGGCATSHPPPLGQSALAEAESFPYYILYWAGHRFEGYPITAADGRKGYSPSIGDSVYYGDCDQGMPRSLLGGSCHLPLQVTTVIYRLHSNATLGAQRNTIMHGVPATTYDGGSSIELYSGRVAIDIFSETPAQARRAAEALLPLNAPGSAREALPLPIYCPGLSGTIPPPLRRLMSHLPGRACQRVAT